MFDIIWGLKLKEIKQAIWVGFYNPCNLLTDIFFSISLAAKNVTWTITTYTEEKENAGTNHPVYIRLTGSRGDKTDWRLITKTDFKRGIQNFFLKTVDVGTVNKVELHISGNDGWDMMKVCSQIYSVFKHISPS